ncbi:TonB-dependent receptor plug domain-containing protein [Niabella hibiscisoli]|uniref:TonB-dependent receptor plug domain-containing protein n=1 Tax=Niabella hibiscisoli TaxID=1825928 RepID=UPI001F0D1F69|nr:TonB-dependent receptor plug domain-containing protein [Niabella hibiscisoli]MCH5719256.1 TonB-dependent receptor plug domain-containing protein [Niabella hibiscisoli]
MEKLLKLCLLMGILCLGKLLAAQTPVISGTVKDESTGSPLSGVTVTLKNTSTATITDQNGNFTLAISAATRSVTVLCTMVGYQSKEVEINTGAAASISLSPASSNLDEVVVVGYGTQKKVNLSGAVNTVDKKLLTNRPVTSLTNALQGTVPGVAVQSRPGDVGNDLGAINVRGRGNTGSSSPLFVVDGVIVQAGDFARINPNDVENVSILKDASASAIYGSRAAYGVILVTTKKEEVTFV